MEKKRRTPSPQTKSSRSARKTTTPVATKKKQKKVKKLRKSSLSKAQKNFAVFNKVDEHVNKYENLDIDLSDTEENRASKNSVILIQDGDEAGDEPKEIQVVDIESESEEDEPSTKSASEQVSEGSNTDENALDNNDDFIPFAFSSDDEDDDSGDDDKNGGGNKDSGEYNDKGSTAVQAETAGSYDYDNYDDEYPTEDTRSRKTLNTDYPWILNHDHSKQREIADWLTLEIKDFVAYISPSREEIEARNQTISKIRNAVKRLWPDADLHVFGSFATDLYLPGSDIDCVINSGAGDKENRNSLYSLASFLKRQKLATQVEVISKARVPIIKFVEPESQIHIDVSFERTNGLEAAKVIRGWLEHTPGLRELVLIVKQFLSARRLNSVHTGGLGGFSIICLVYSFLQLHPRIISGDINCLENLGTLAIDFFELYGKNFAYDDVAISVSEHQASYLPKSEYPNLQNPRTTFSLAIQDPGDPDNNISRGSFNVRDIKKAFAGAFDLLTNRCFELDAATFKDRLGKSILGNVIKYRGKQRDFKDERDLVVNKAIAENELYHRKRGTIVHEDVFTDVSDTEDKEAELYKLEEPPKKKQRKNKSKSKEKTSKVQATKSTQKPAASNTPASKPVHNETVENLMGINDDDEDDYNPTTAVPLDVEDEDNSDGKSRSDIRKKSVDAQTKRDYWLSKGQAL